MKKLFTLSLILATAFAAKSQTPPNKNLGIVNKTTATWCGPCGSWGWTLFEDVIADNQAKAICMGTYSSSSSDLYNQTASDFYNDFAPGSGLPAFNALGLNRTEYSTSGGIYPTITRTNVKASIDSFVLTPVVASTGYTYTISGSTLNVNTTTKFWSANNGDFYVNVYLVEDGVMNIQNGQTGTVAHHDVLRGGVTGTWGSSIVNGAVTANQTFNKSFTYTIPATWDKAKLQVVTIIWKKVGSDYQFINANNVANAPAGVTDILEAGNIRMYPNPTANYLNISMDIDESTEISYDVFDMRGQLVYTQSPKKVNYGTHDEVINTSTWSNGNYMIRLNSGKNNYSGKILIAH
ncbi:MAG: Omp28-related outer membrane protein [Chitinophagaceae bacterium]|nr:Omp28-related outer membrane protein [Chitinophagaceae bacterium]